MNSLFATFNCGKALQSPEQVSKLASQALKSAKYDLIAFGFQEICPIMEGCFADYRQYLTPILAGLDSVLSESYQQVDVVALGAILLVVYASPDVTIATKTSATARCGMLKSGLKGGVGLRFKASHNGATREFTIVTAHLAANEGMLLARNHNYYELVTRLDFGDGYGAYKPGSHFVFMGDLNYRALQEVNDEDVNEETVGERLRVAGDELTKEMNQGRVLYGLEEAPIDFKPTYKFFPNTETYNTKRIPSWCDRILYLGGGANVNWYHSLPEVNWTDHRPVALSLTIDSDPVDVLTEEMSIALTDKPYPNLYLGLSPQRDLYATIGSLADQTIGWSLYLGTTRRGNVYLAVGLLCVYLAFRIL